MPFRIRRSAVLAFTVACAPAGQQKVSDTLAATTVVTMPESAPRFLALGDSYSIGEAVAERDRWPMQLARELRASGLDVDDPVIVARTGWTVDELNAGIDAVKPEGPFGLVTLLIGVNDQYRGRAAEEYRSPFREMLRRAIAFAGGEPSRVIVVSIPDWGVTPFAAGRDSRAIAAAIDEFNAVNRDESIRAGAHYVDVTANSRTARGDTSKTAPDGLHPSAGMYTEWTALILPAASTILRSASQSR